MTSRDALAELLRQGFRGTCASAALETGFSKITVYVGMRALEAEGFAAVVDTTSGRGGTVDVWGAGNGVRIVGHQRPSDIVSCAIAARHPLELWAAGHQL